MSVAESKTAPSEPSAPSATVRLKREELFSCYSHLLGALGAVVGTVVLAVLSRSTAGVVVSLVYGVSMVFMFGASAAYHALKDTENGESFWRRVDHLAIFFMIAGSYTPICWFHLSGTWRWSILGTQWGLVLLGAVFKLLFLGAPRWVTAAIYVIMGWVVVVPLHRLLASWDTATTALLVTGGVAYTVGAVIYALKRPDPIPGFLGFHEVFHLAVVVGAAIHYIAIFRIVT
ncbi:MAG: hemolysin III family protein [bacterium]